MKSIIIVEDNEDIGYILDLFLSEEGFRVQLCATVAEFNATLRAELPDLFLLTSCCLMAVAWISVTRLKLTAGLRICRF